MMYYQIINIGSPGNISCSNLGIDDQRFAFIDENHVNSQLPAIFLYWGMSDADKTYTGRWDLSQLVSDGKILPVVDEETHFRDYIPEVLGSINAFETTKNELAGIGHWILKHFGLLECTNRIFISYKRSETSELAHQLFNELIKRKYNPFLDSYSIESGVDFQEYLMNELVDSDVFIFLNSPNYFDSEFTRAELDCAQKLSMGIVQVVFEGTFASKILNSADIPVGEKAEKEKKYDKKMVNAILDLVEKKRAVMYEYRRQAIINAYRMENEHDVIKVSDNGILWNESKKEILKVVSHVPSSFDFQKADKLFGESYYANPDASKQLLYSSQYVRRDILSHIEWLNESLPVKSKDINR